MLKSSRVSVCQLLSRSVRQLPLRAVISPIQSRAFSAEPGTVVVSIDLARSTTAAALKKIGWDDEDAAAQAAIMTSSEICGNSQGLVKMYDPSLMAPAPGVSKPVVERETDTSAVINGNLTPGMVVAMRAADLAVKKVKDGNQAICIVSSYNSSTSSGQMGYYVERMAQSGVIGIGVTNSPELVAAASGSKPVFGTNPIAVAMPQSAGPPFTFDMATSAMALYGVLTAKAMGTPLPVGVAYDSDGKPTTDAAKANPHDGGALATFGGHKGAGLSLCVELLAGALSGGAVLGQVESKKVAKNLGHTFIAIDPNKMTDNFDSKVSSILAAVKASGPGIRIPGEQSAKTAAERTAKGEMPIPAKVWEMILKTAEKGL